MSEYAPDPGTAPGPSPELEVQLLGVVAERDADHTLSVMEQLITRLRADVQRAAVARYELSHISADVLREAMRLHAIRARRATLRASDVEQRWSDHGDRAGCRDVSTEVQVDVRVDVRGDVQVDVRGEREQVEVDAVGGDQ